MESIVKMDLDGKVLKITLIGKLDAVKAPDLMEDLKTYGGQGLEKIVYYTSELEYISSAGLRAIIFSKQKVGGDAEIYFVAPQEAVLDVVNMSGLDNFLTIVDEM